MSAAFEPHNRLTAILMVGSPIIILHLLEYCYEHTLMSSLLYFYTDWHCLHTNCVSHKYRSIISIVKWIHFTKYNQNCLGNLSYLCIDFGSKLKSVKVVQVQHSIIASQWCIPCSLANEYSFLGSERHFPHICLYSIHAWSN